MHTFQKNDPVRFEIAGVDYSGRFMGYVDNQKLQSYVAVVTPGHGSEPWHSSLYRILTQNLLENKK